METIAEIIKYLLIFMGVIFLLLIVVLAILWKMSPTHPWRLVVAALARRLAATWGIALIDIPATAMQPLGDVWDIGSLIFLAWYWYTFFRDDAGRALRMLREVARSNPSQIKGAPSGRGNIPLAHGACGIRESLPDNSPPP